MSERTGRFCPSCGAAVDEDDLFCMYCGAGLRTGAAPAASSDTGGRGETPAGWTETAPGKSGTVSGKTAAAGEKKGGGKSVFGYLFLGLLALVFVFTQFLSPSRVYKDYDSAGEHLRKQILKQEETLYVSYNSPKNELIGDFMLDDLIQASVAYTGNPLEGDRLALLCWPVSYDGTKVKKSNGSYDYNLKIQMEYILTKQQEEMYEQTAKEILEGLHLDNASDYEKIRAIYQYICTNVTYDYANLEDDSYMLKYSGYAAAVNHTAVCAGIAELFYYLANSAGVEAHIRTNASHAWNYVKLDGSYYYADATWDLGVSEDQYQYFLKGRLDFEDHLGKISFSLWGVSNLLQTSYTDYPFSDYAYGSTGLT